MDGSLADFENGLRAVLAKIASPCEPTLPDSLWEAEKMPHIKERMRLVKDMPGWWLGLDRIEMGFEVLSMARQAGFEVQILTKGPSSHSIAWREKIEWCQRQPELEDAAVHIVSDKGLVFGNLLYDDYPVYMERWLSNRPRGLGIMPLTPWNREFTHPNVVKWDGSNRDEVRRALEIAASRLPNEPLMLAGSS